MKALIVAANNRVPYVEVCMSSIHNHNFSIYLSLPALKKRVLSAPSKLGASFGVKVSIG
jgi:hypothetical protein